MRELEDLPNHYSHTIYRQYIDVMKDMEKQKALEAEQVQDEIEDAMG